MPLASQSRTVAMSIGRANRKPWTKRQPSDRRVAQLPERLDALDHEVEAERAGEADHRGHDRGVAVAVAPSSRTNERSSFSASSSNRFR